MNKISSLSNSDLLLKTKVLVSEEKRITQEVLAHLEEIESRKLYLARGYPSLFAYCVEELHYFESSANRRISAMRIIKAIPQAKEKLAEGVVNLSTLTQLHTFLRNEEKEKIYSSEMKLDLLEKIEGKSQNQCEREFIKIAPLSIKLKERERPVSEDLTQMTFVASKELKGKIEQLRNLLAHKNSNPTTAELIELLADMALKELCPVKHKFTLRVQDGTGRTSAADVDVGVGTTASQLSPRTTKNFVKNKPKNSRHLPAALRRYVWKRDQGCCQYVDKETKKKCESEFALQIDHLHPYSLGGSNDETNLRLLCRAHNQWRTRELFGH